jgi:endonuclease YncB( thermonuclease family)
MADTIRGPVIEIIDGDTFDMKVTHTGKDNKTSYKDQERIRIAAIDEPELRTPAGQRSKDKLEGKLKGKEVRCYVQARDDYGRLVAEVKVIG